MSGKEGCGGSNDALKEHLKNCCAYGQRPAAITKCAPGTTASTENPCLGGSAPPDKCCGTPSPCPPTWKPTCDVPPTTTFECPCSPPPPPPCLNPPAEKVEKECPPPPPKEEKKC